MLLLLPYVQNILELVQRCLSDSERTDSSVRLALGLVGDLADSFSDGQIKQLLLQEWLASELRQKGRMPAETKKTLRWAREVWELPSYLVSLLVLAWTQRLLIFGVFFSKMVKRATA